MANPQIFNREDYVRVTNGTPETIEGRFNSEDYEFPPGEAVDISIEAARHIFAFGEEDKSRALARLGWVKTTLELKAAMARLGKVVFGDVPGIEVAQIKRIPHATPIVKGDGSTGGGKLPPEDPLAEAAEQF